MLGIATPVVFDHRSCLARVFVMYCYVLGIAEWKACIKKQITCCARLQCFSDRHVDLHAVTTSPSHCKPFVRGQAWLVLEPSLFGVRLMALGMRFMMVLIGNSFMEER